MIASCSFRKKQRIEFHGTTSPDSGPAHPLSIVFAPGPELTGYAYNPKEYGFDYPLGVPLTQLAEQVAHECFRSVSRDAGSADYILTCRPALASAGMPTGIHPTHEALLVLQWSVVDRNGRLIWMEEVRGTRAKEMRGRMSRANRDLWDEMILDLREKSARAIRNAPEIRSRY